MQQIIWTLKKYILVETKRPILWKNITPLGVFLIWIITHLATSESINKQWTMWTVVYFNQLSGAIAGQNLFLSSFLHVFASFYAKMAKNRIIPICWLTKKLPKNWWKHVFRSFCIWRHVSTSLPWLSVSENKFSPAFCSARPAFLWQPALENEARNTQFWLIFHHICAKSCKMS